MFNDEPRHLAKAARSWDRAAIWALAAAGSAWLLATLDTRTAVRLALLCIAFLCARCAFINLRSEERFNVLAIAAGLAVSILPIIAWTTHEPERKTESLSTTTTSTTSEQTTSSSPRSPETTSTTATSAPPQATTTTSPPAPPTTTTVRPTDRHQIVWVGGGPEKCLDTTGVGPGKHVRLGDCTDGNATWKLSGGQLRGGPSDLCLQRLATTDMAEVVTASCVAGEERQRWTKEGDLIKNGNSCLDVDTDTMEVDLLWCTDDPSTQMWEIG